MENNRSNQRQQRRSNSEGDQQRSQGGPRRYPDYDGDYELRGEYRDSSARQRNQRRDHYDDYQMSQQPDHDFRNNDQYGGNQYEERSRNVNAAGRGGDYSDLGNENRDYSDSFGRESQNAGRDRSEYDRVEDRYGNEFHRRAAQQEGSRSGSDFNRQGVERYDSDRDYRGYEDSYRDNRDTGFGSGRSNPRRTRGSNSGRDAQSRYRGTQSRYDESYQRKDGNDGPYAGRGPKGFTRSSENLKEQVCEVLENAGEIDASEIEVEVQDCEVTLTGCTTDRRQKRLAEDCAQSVNGIRDVHNRLTIDDGESGKQQSQDKSKAGSKSGSKQTKQSSTNNGGKRGTA